MNNNQYINKIFKKKKIINVTVLTPRYTVAGVPLAQVRLAKSLSKFGFKVTLVIGYIDSNFIMPKLENIRIIHLNYKRVILMIFPIIKFLIKEKQDYIFSAEDHLNTVLFFAKIIANSKTKISLSSRVTPYDTYSNFIFSKRWFLKNLNKLVIKKANVMSCVSTEMIDQYKKIFPNSKHVCIYNIIINDEAKIKMNEEVNHKWLNNKKKPVIIAAGKLAEWKGFKYLIEAFNILIKKKDARLIILGDGHLKNQLKMQINDLGLNSLVDLHGYVNNTLKYFKKSDVFVLSSLVEGMPNVLIEAMMCGCTPVSTNCPTGPKEIIKNNKFGYLVKPKQPIEMAKAIELAIDNPIDKGKLYQGIKLFSEEEVLNLHFKYLTE